MAARVVFALSVCLLTLSLSTVCARAQSEQSGLIVVTVRDASTGKPIDNAQVFLLGGDTPQSSLTNAKGLLLFQNVVPGTYRVEVKAGGYFDSAAAEADVGEGERVNIAVALAPTRRAAAQLRGLKVIAKVVARPAVSVTTQAIGAGSAQRKVSQSLVDALGKIAGVDIEDDLYGGNSAFNISLRGADASQTGYSIDGVQINGGAGQAMAGLQDLFSGASVNFAPSAMSEGGMVNYYTVQPSKLFGYHFTGVVGNYGNTLGMWTATGGAGKAAFAIEHTAGGADYPLDGAFFKDETGHAYAHQGGYARRADMFKTALFLSPVTTFKYTLMRGSSSFSPICASRTTLLPCGWGPGVINDGRTAMQMLSISSMAGHLQYNAFLTLGDSHSSENDPNRAVNGTIEPFYSRIHFPWSIWGFYTSASARRHTFSSGMYVNQSEGSNQSSYGLNGSLSTARIERFSGIWVADKVKANDKLALIYRLSRASGTGAGSSLVFYGNATWQPRRQDVFSLGAGVGSANPAPGLSRVVGDALTGQYDCFNKSIFVNGPSDRATPQSNVQYDAGWRHSWKYGQINLNAWRTQGQGQEIFASVPIGAEPASIFPGGPAAYLASLQQVWSQPTVCGAMPFDPAHVYVTHFVSGLDRVTQGFTLSGRIDLTRTLVAFPSYALTSSALSALDPRLAFPGSYLSAGTQLPHHPLRTAGLTLDQALPRSRMEWLLNAQFTSANNWQNLPAYTVYNAGLVLHLQRGTLQFFAGNLFGTQTGLFSTYEGVNPYPLQGGGSFALASTPLEPRSFSVQYDLHWQQHPAPPRKPLSPHRK